MRRLVDSLGGNLLEIAADILGQPALRTSLDLLAGSQCDVRPRGVGLEAAVIAAFAAAPFGVDGGVADLTGAIGGAVVELAVEDDSSADPRPDGDPDGVSRAAGRAHPPFTQDGAVGIVVERGGELQPVVDDLAERQIYPTEVRRQQDDPLLVSSGPGAPTPTPMISAPGYSRFVCSIVRLARAISRSRTSRSPGFRAGRLAAECVQSRAILGNAADDQVGATDVNSEDKSHPTPPHWLWRPAPRLRFQPTALACIGDDPGGRSLAHVSSKAGMPARPFPA